MIFHRNLSRNLSEDLERIQKRAVRIMLPDYKHRDTLKIANIVPVYDRILYSSKQRKMQIIPLNLDSVLLFLHNSKLAYLSVDRKLMYLSWLT